MSEREDLARIIGKESPSLPDSVLYELADLIIVKHIKPLRQALAKAEAAAEGNLTLLCLERTLGDEMEASLEEWRTKTEAAETRVAELEVELTKLKDQLHGH